MSFSRFGQRYDPLASDARNARNELFTAERTGDVKKIQAAQTKLAAAYVAIRARDAERKATRAKNKALRAQGIDPSKKPEQMTVEQFEHARKTLRAAIEPQFPAYKKQIFNVLRADVDEWLSMLDEAKGDAYAAAYEGADYSTLSDYYKLQNPQRNEMKAKLERGNAWLQNIRHWSSEAPLKSGQCRDRGRPGAKDPRTPRTDASIDAELEKKDARDDRA